MNKPVLTRAAVIASFGMVLGAVNTHARSLPHGGGSIMSDKPEAASIRSISALDTIISWFISTGAEKRATTTASPEHKTSDCANDKNAKIIEPDGEKDGDKKTPQGPEPIYFAF